MNLLKMMGTLEIDFDVTYYVKLENYSLLLLVISVIISQNFVIELYICVNFQSYNYSIDSPHKYNDLSHILVDLLTLLKI